MMTDRQETGVHRHSSQRKNSFHLRLHGKDTPVAQTTTMVADVWTREQLMGNGGEESASPKKAELQYWGVPGHLTAEEADVFVNFQAEVEGRGAEFRSTVYCFGEEEGECWALCRWLRARKYNLDETIKMVEEASQTRADAKAHDFYPNPVDALGCEARLFFAQYPQLYTGFAKNGAILFISKPGILNVDGMECITSLDGILKFHWHIMMHDFAQRLRAQKAKNPDFKKFECFCVLDLNQLTASKLSRRALTIIKEQAAIDSICFPETMSKMLIVNAPTFFSATWRIIKGWLDPRTASKIEVISGRSACEKRLLELVDEKQLPCDYGGKGPDTNKIMMEDFGGDADRMDTRMMYLRGHGSEVITVGAQESLEVTVFTRSDAGAKFSILDNDSKAELVHEVLVKHHDGENSTSQSITTTPIAGPVELKIKVDSLASRFSTHNYLVVFIFKNK